MKNNTSHKSTRTDIVATIGFSSESIKILQQMVNAGLTIARINMSHGDHAEHHMQITNLRALKQKKIDRVRILVDLAGPKIRIGNMEKDTYIVEGDKIILTTKGCIGNSQKIHVTYKKLPKEVSKGQYILVSDGKRKLQVISTNGVDEIMCKVITGGHVTSRRGINVPGANLTIPVITSKDKKDIIFALEHQADYVALSFVRSSKDIVQCRRLLQDQPNIKIIAKIETREAMDNLEKIIKVSDGVMIARGDLAMEIGFENVPLVQRKIIKLCRESNKFVILATQVLDSMEKSPTPTRAEVSDIAFAVADGVHAIMLSGESAIGKYPVESVETIYKVARKIEEAM